jgi:hypothetical protein
METIHVSRENWSGKRMKIRTGDNGTFTIDHLPGETFSVTREGEELVLAHGGRWMATGGYLGSRDAYFDAFGITRYGTGTNAHIIAAAKLIASIL